MADSKISDLTELTSPADTDEVAIVDKSDTTQASTGSTKRITRSNFLGTNLSAFEGITIKDEDDMASDSATAVPTQQSVKAYVDTYGFSGATFNAPQGFLLNGKIVPSVASNNLTVALKTLAGTDPSASYPVYVRIGDTVRSVTSALSVTKNAGTNWMNAGGSGLATKEIDYFVYLGYNATDGVTIGFSRIPYGTKYGDFSATTTNEKYCAISTITNAASTDYYENVGRFAATLSAGAGYTWSVPTFTAKNLIQRPIYETRWLNWSPTISFTAGVSPSSLSYGDYKYKLISNTCFIKAASIYDSAGTTVTRINHTPPFLPLQNNYYIGSLTVANGLTPASINALLQFTNGENLNGYLASSTVDRFGINTAYEI